MSTPINNPTGLEVRVTKIYRMPGHYAGKGDPIVDLQVDDQFRLTACAPFDGKVMRCRNLNDIVKPNEMITEITGVGEPTWEVFVSYRRSNAPGHAGHLGDHLTANFGQGQVFHDVNSLPHGHDFFDVIRDRLNRAYVMVVVIGPNWASDPRLKDPNDLHREEIRTAIERAIHIQPVLVNGAKMPSEDQLPEDIRVLARRQAIEITDERWAYDSGRVVESVERVLAKSPSRLRFLAQVPPWDHKGWQWIQNNPPSE